MIKAIFQAKTINQYRYMDNGQKCVIWGCTYNTETFAASAFNGFGGVNIRSQNNTIVPFIGGGFASNAYSGNLAACTAFINPYFLDSKHPSIYPDGDDYVIFLNGTTDTVIKVDADFNIKQYGNTNYGGNFARNSAAIRLPDGDFILVCNESYYDRARLFRRYNSSLQQVHDFKLNMNYAEAQIHFFDGVKFYVSANGLNSYGRHILYGYDVGTKVATTIIDINGGSKRATSIPSQMINLDNGHKLYFVIQPQNNNRLYYRAVDFDPSSGTATRVDFTADYGDKTESDVIYLNASDRRQGIVSFVTKTDTGVYHLHVLFTSRSDFNAGTPYYRMVTYRVDLANKKLIYKSHYEFNQPVYSYMPLSPDYNGVLIIASTAMFFATFVADKEEWVFNSIPSSTFFALIDSLGRLFVYDNAGNAYPYLKTIPAVQYIELENKDIVYRDEPIDNNLLVDYFNYEGKRISVKVTLSLSGALTFDDGSREKTIITSAEQTTKVPVKCYGGFYEINPKTIVPLV